MEFYGTSWKVWDCVGYWEISGRQMDIWDVSWCVLEKCRITWDNLGKIWDTSWKHMGFCGIYFDNCGIGTYLGNYWMIWEICRKHMRYSLQAYGIILDIWKYLENYGMIWDMGIRWNYIGTSRRTWDELGWLLEIWERSWTYGTLRHNYMDISWKHRHMTYIYIWKDLGHIWDSTA